MLKVLFVCMGNICRSPIAHGILENFAKAHEYTDKIMVNSAGTSAFHVGSYPDSRSVKVSQKHGIELKHKARQFKSSDLQEYDFILVMDHLNYDDVLSLAQNEEQRAKVSLLRHFDPLNNSIFDVPDPYYGTDLDFEEVFAMCNRSIQGFVDFLKTQKQLA